MAKNTEDYCKKNPVIIGNPERMNDFTPFSRGKVSYRQPDDQDPQSQEKNELYKRDDFAPESSGSRLRKCH
jgi:hypothetical protein